MTIKTFYNKIIINKEKRCKKMNDKTVKQQIKVALAERDMTLTDLYKKLIEKYNKEYSLQNLSSKINRNTLKYSEVQEIAEILQYDIVWKDSKEAE